jgi:hypothetical protein
MAVTLVVAWDADLKEPLEVRRSVNMRHARHIAEEFEKAYPWSPRISFYEEVDFLATEEGMKGYSELEIKHARELQETGSTDITEIVVQMLEDEQKQATRDWHTRALVRFKETVTVRAPESEEYTFRAGQEREMVQWGRAGRAVDRTSWWTSYDIDGAYIIDAGKVEVVKIIEEVLPD